MPRYMTEGRKVRADVTSRLGSLTSREEAYYRPQENADSKEFCSECVHYLQPGEENSSCRRVAGIVEAHYVCDMFVPRESQGQTAPQIVINVGGRPIAGKLPNAS